MANLSYLTNVPVNAGDHEYIADEPVAELSYVEDVSNEFLEHAYSTGSVYIVETEADPWVREARARHSMRFGEILLAPDDVACYIDSETAVGVDTLMRMRESQLVRLVVP